MSKRKTRAAKKSNSLQNESKKLKKCESSESDLVPGETCQRADSEHQAMHQINNENVSIDLNECNETRIEKSHKPVIKENTNDVSENISTVNTETGNHAVIDASNSSNIHQKLSEINTDLSLASHEQADQVGSKIDFLNEKLLHITQRLSNLIKDIHSLHNTTSAPLMTPSSSNVVNATKINNPPPPSIKDSYFNFIRSQQQRQRNDQIKTMQALSQNSAKSLLSNSAFAHLHQNKQ